MNGHRIIGRVGDPQITLLHKTSGRVITHTSVPMKEGHGGRVTSWISSDEASGWLPRVLTPG
jgi:hypothetical protein